MIKSLELDKDYKLFIDDLIFIIENYKIYIIKSKHSSDFSFVISTQHEYDEVLEKLHIIDRYMFGSVNKLIYDAPISQYECNCFCLLLSSKTLQKVLIRKLLLNFYDKKGLNEKKYFNNYWVEHIFLSKLNLLHIFKDAKCRGFIICI